MIFETPCIARNKSKDLFHGVKSENPDGGSVPISRGESFGTTKGKKEGGDISERTPKKREREREKKKRNLERLF